MTSYEDLLSAIANFKTNLNVDLVSKYMDILSTFEQYTVSSRSKKYWGGNKQQTSNNYRGNRHHNGKHNVDIQRGGINRGNTNGYERGNKSSTRYQPKKRQQNDAIKKLMVNTDKIINNFNKSLNKLTTKNYDIIYKEVVTTLTDYISNFVTDYIESYVKFGINGKCHLEALNMELIKEKYNYYQCELWKLLFNKFITSSMQNRPIYYVFLQNLITWKTEIFNQSVINNAKSVFKTTTGYNYDIIKLDGVDDNNAKEFFTTTITELNERDTMVYNKVVELIAIFKEYDFMLSEINSSFKKMNVSITDFMYGLEPEINNEYHKLIANWIRKPNSGPNLGYLLQQYIISSIINNNNSNNNCDITIQVFINILNNIVDNDINDVDIIDKVVLTDKGNILLGLFDFSETDKQYINDNMKDKFKEKLEIIKNHLPSIVKYKMMDVISSL